MRWKNRAWPGFAQEAVGMTVGYVVALEEGLGRSESEVRCRCVTVGFAIRAGEEAVRQ